MSIETFKKKCCLEFNWTSCNVIELFQGKIYKLFSNHEIVSDIPSNDVIYVYQDPDPLPFPNGSGDNVNVAVFLTQRNAYSDLGTYFGTPVFISLPSTINISSIHEISTLIYRKLVSSIRRFSRVKLFRKINDNSIESDCDLGIEWEPIPDLFAVKFLVGKPVVPDEQFFNNGWKSSLNTVFKLYPQAQVSNADRPVYGNYSAPDERPMTFADRPVYGNYSAPDDRPITFPNSDRPVYGNYSAPDDRPITFPNDDPPVYGNYSALDNRPISSPNYSAIDDRPITSSGTYNYSSFGNNNYPSTQSFTDLVPSVVSNFQNTEFQSQNIDMPTFNYSNTDTSMAYSPIVEPSERMSEALPEPISNMIHSMTLSGEVVFVLDFTESSMNRIFGHGASKSGAYDNNRNDTFDAIETQDFIDFKHVAKKTIEEEKNRVLSLEDCISEFTKEEVLADTETYYCSNCKIHRTIKKKIDIWTTPEILIFSLKRFSNSARASFRSLNSKIDSLITFPITGLDLSGIVVGSGLQDRDKVEIDQNESEGLVYDLFAVSNHIGGSNGGHCIYF